MLFTNCIIRRETPGTLDAQEWVFVVLDNQVVLDRYMELSRPTKRHKELTNQFYNRLNTRDCTLEISEVPLPDDVAAEALAKVIAQFRVVKEYTR